MSIKLKSLLMENRDIESFKKDMANGRLIDTFDKGKYIYRGSSSVSNIVTKIVPRKDRKPLDTGEVIDELLDYWREVKAPHFPSRRRSAFFSTRLGTVEKFGTPHICFVPKNDKTHGFKRDTSSYTLKMTTALVNLSHPYHDMKRQFPKMQALDMIMYLQDNYPLVFDLFRSGTNKVQPTVASLKTRAIGNADKIDMIKKHGLDKIQRRVENFLRKAERGFSIEGVDGRYIDQYVDTVKDRWDDFNFIFNSYFINNVKIDDLVKKNYEFDEIISECPYYYMVDINWWFENMEMFGV